MKKDLEKQLETRKIKPTAMRLLVLDFIRKHDHAISLRELENGFSTEERREVENNTTALQTW